MRTRTILTVSAGLYLAVACGAESEQRSESSAIAPAPSVITSTSVAANVESTQLALDLDPSMDIGLLPPEYYTTSKCEAVPSVPATGNEIDFNPDAYFFSDVDAALLSAEFVLLATVGDVLSPVRIVPEDLPADFLKAVGARSANDLGWDVTPVMFSVERTVAGSAISSAAMLELGCLAGGATSSTTPGQRLLVFATQTSNTRGPAVLFGQTHSIVDWLTIEVDGSLSNKTGVLGLPSRSSFLVGKNIDDAIRLIEEAKPPTPTTTH